MVFLIGCSLSFSNRIRCSCLGDEIRNSSPASSWISASMALRAAARTRRRASRARPRRCGPRRTPSRPGRGSAAARPRRRGSASPSASSRASGACSAPIAQTWCAAQAASSRQRESPRPAAPWRRARPAPPTSADACAEVLGGDRRQRLRTRRIDQVGGDFDVEVRQRRAPRRTRRRASGCASNRMPTQANSRARSANSGCRRADDLRQLDLLGRTHRHRWPRSPRRSRRRCRRRRPRAVRPRRRRTAAPRWGSFGELGDQRLELRRRPPRTPDRDLARAGAGAHPSPSRPPAAG